MAPGVKSAAGLRGVPECCDSGSDRAGRAGAVSSPRALRELFRIPRESDLRTVGFFAE